jgi:hypothetical protein
MVKREVKIAISVALILSASLIFLLPFVFSAITGVPFWFLFPISFPLGLTPSEGIMSVEVYPVAPTMNNQLVTVAVFDANNNTPIANALVEINEGSYGKLDISTGSDGTAQFPFIGFTTQISVSKDGYADSNHIVIPQIPADWIRTLTYQDITLVLTIICSFGPALYLYRKPEAKMPIRRKRK